MLETVPFDIVMVPGTALTAAVVGAEITTAGATA
jgi:hypothetical protein